MVEIYFGCGISDLMGFVMIDWCRQISFYIVEGIGVCVCVVEDYEGGVFLFLVFVDIWIVCFFVDCDQIVFFDNFLGFGKCFV